MVRAMYELCRKISDADSFDRIVLTLILVNAAVMGFETSLTLSNQYGEFFFWIIWGSQFIFAAEIAVRIVSYGPSFGRFFGRFWNIFDFVIVVLSFMPAVGSFVTVARIFRLLRVLRILSVSDEIRDFLSHTQQSFGISFYFGILWAVLLYVFAISGIYLFGDAVPQQFGTLGLAVQTILYVLLLQDIPMTVATLSAADRIGANVYLFLLAGSSLVLLLNAIGAFAAHHLRDNRYDQK